MEGSGFLGAALSEAHKEGPGGMRVWNFTRSGSGKAPRNQSGLGHSGSERTVRGDHFDLNDAPCMEQMEKSLYGNVQKEAPAAFEQGSPARVVNEIASAVLNLVRWMEERQRSMS
jgi:nucleoside-diphosphate-sugar epimerase